MRDRLYSSTSTDAPKPTRPASHSLQVERSMQKLGLGPSASDARGSVMFPFDNALFHFRRLRALRCWTSLHFSRWVVV